MLLGSFVMPLLALPEVEESTSHGTPSLKIRGKFLARVKDPDTIVLKCPLEEKEMLLSAASDIFYETDHYKSWPAVLVRIRRIAPDELRQRLERAGAEAARRRLRRERQASG